MKTIGIIGTSTEQNEDYLSNFGDKKEEVYYHHIIIPTDLIGRKFDSYIEHPSAKKNPLYKLIMSEIKLNEYQRSKKAKYDRSELESSYKEYRTGKTYDQLTAEGFLEFLLKQV